MCAFEFGMQLQVIGWIITACAGALAIGGALFVVWLLITMAMDF